MTVGEGPVAANDAPVAVVSGIVMPCPSYYECESQAQAVLQKGAPATLRLVAMN